MLSPRRYQKSAIKKVFLDLNTKRKGENLPKNTLFVMATGSGKTLVSYSVLNHILEVRERFYQRFPPIKRTPFQVTIFSHRIDALDQLHDDLLVGRNGKSPMITDKFRARVHSRIHHSQTDGDEIQPGGKDTPDISIIFSTFQTSNTKNGAHVKNSNFVIVDDAHVILPGNGYDSGLQHALTQNPPVLANTATPDNYTNELFGKPAYTYSLGKYLASQYSPSLEYHFLTQQGIPQEKIEKLNEEITKLGRMRDMDKRKKKYGELREKFDKLLSKYPNVSLLVDDLLKRLQIGKDGEIDKTLIFCPNIATADEVAKDINTALGKKGVALSYHSKNDGNNGLDTFALKESECKILVVVDKMNESVDLPDLKNVVLWRGTNSMKIFLQQFGRGLRGKKHIRYFDYVGGLMNFIGIHGIYTEYQKNRTKDKDDVAQGSETTSKFFLVGGYTGTTDTLIDMSTLGLRLAEKKDYADIPPLVSVEEIKRMFRENEILLHQILSIKDWLVFSKKWNAENAIQRGYHLPRVIEGLYSILGVMDPYYEEPKFLPVLLLDQMLPEKKEWKKDKIDQKKKLNELISKGIIPVEALFDDDTWSKWFQSFSQVEGTQESSVENTTEITFLKWNRDYKRLFIGGVQIFKHLEHLWTYTFRSYGYNPNVLINEESVRSFLAGENIKYLLKRKMTRNEFLGLLRDDMNFRNIVRGAYTSVDANRWNRTVGWKKGIRMPGGRPGAISLLGGEGHLKEELLCLMDGREYNPPVITKEVVYRPANGHDIYIAFRDKRITEDQFRRIFTNRDIWIEWNQNNAHGLGVDVPYNISSLFFQRAATDKELEAYRENSDVVEFLRKGFENSLNALKTKDENFFKIIHMSPDDLSPV